VCSTWGVLEKGYYLLGLWRGRVDFPELKRLVGSLGREWNPSAILVEDAASGQSLIQELRHERSLSIIPVKIDRDKISRAQSITPLIEAGKVFLPKSAPWLADFVDDCGISNGCSR
jgi:predicted phage terminase large subunit-like protein